MSVLYLQIILIGIHAIWPYHYYYIYFFKFHFLFHRVNVNDMFAQYAVLYATLSDPINRHPCFYL